MDYEYKSDLVKIIKQLSESECNAIAYVAENQTRFFYNGSMGDESFLKVLKKIVERNHLFDQNRANRQARQALGLSRSDKQAARALYERGVQQGRAFKLDNLVYDRLYQTSYRKSGHLYLYGVRIY